MARSPRGLSGRRMRIEIFPAGPTGERVVFDVDRDLDRGCVDGNGLQGVGGEAGFRDRLLFERRDAAGDQAFEEGACGGVHARGEVGVGHENLARWWWMGVRADVAKGGVAL